ncbi:MAG TPA: hypothetical protein VKU36_05215 [Candidatus Babeliales bacterium]|nr:hypothetical protein [Candidatus Babeliales bacterium]
MNKKIVLSLMLSISLLVTASEIVKQQTISATVSFGGNKEGKDYIVSVYNAIVY